MTLNLSWIDTHTHLDHEYPFSVDEYLKNARQNGVTQFVTIGTTPGKFLPLRNLADQHPDVYFAVGVHPHEAKDFNDEVAREMRALSNHQKCVAIGEIGLDFYYEHSPRETQKQVLHKQLELALEIKKPVVIHARDAEPELLDSLKVYASKCKLNQGPGVIHCFSGTHAFAMECLNLGFYLSFSGIITFKKADDLRAIVKHVPLDRLLLETDSPFLAPVPYRGKPNQSAYLVETAKMVAQLKGIDLATLSKSTVENSKRIFAL